MFLDRAEDIIQYSHPVRVSILNPRIIRQSVLLIVGVAMLSFCLLPRNALAKRAVVVKTQDVAAFNLALEGFRRSFSGDVLVVDLGGQSISTSQVQEIRNFKPAAIMAIGSGALSSLHQEIQDIPIVFSMVMYSQSQGLSGDNITGVSLETPADEQLTLFRSLIPRLRNIGIVNNPTRANPAVLTAKAAIRDAGLTVLEKDVNSAGDVPNAVTELIGNVDALWILPDASLITAETFRFILVSTLENRVPLFVFSAPFVRQGALVSVGPDYSRIGAEVASIIDEIAAGKQPNQIPPRPPPTSVVINEATASRLDLRIPRNLRSQATLIQ